MDWGMAPPLRHSPQDSRWNSEHGYGSFPVRTEQLAPSPPPQAPQREQNCRSCLQNTAAYRCSAVPVPGALRRPPRCCHARGHRSPSQRPST